MSETSMQKQPPSSAFRPEATMEMCVLCFDVLLLKLHQRRNGKYPMTDFGHLPNNNLLQGTVADHISCPIFVTWDIQTSRTDPQYQLRGCIGSLGPLPLATSVTRYAIQSAFKDRRFQAITLPEVQYLRVGVSLLVQYEPCAHVHDWQVGVHGIMIEWHEAHGQDESRSSTNPNANSMFGAPIVGETRRHSATYLPEVAVEQGWTVEQAVQSLIRKAGFHGIITPALLHRIRCTRYQSSKQKLSFAEYASYRQKNPPNDSSFSPALLEMYQAVTAGATPNNVGHNCRVM